MFESGKVPISQHLSGPGADPGFGVYVHWPFCAQKCPYCDFNSHVRHNGWDETRFLAAYKRELDHVAALMATSPPPVWGRPGGGKSEVLAIGIPPTPNPSPQGAGRSQRTVTSIFFGGGTPSLMKPETTAAILDHIAKLWTVAPGAEITLEANPGSVEAQRFRGYRDAGVNRVSMGFQSLRDDDLRRLGRIHTVAESKAALKIARETFERFSFDLIYARPGQPPDAWRAELAEALDLAGDHVSLYQLTIEPDTPYAALHASGKLIVPDPDAALALYEITQEMTAERGLEPYEISNHARPGQESQHNLLYWRYGEYAGVGPGAHGRLLLASDRIPPPPLWGRPGGGKSELLEMGIPPTPNPSPPRGGGLQRFATVTEKNPEAWCELVEQTGSGLTELTILARSEQADEMLLMGLRLREGVDLDRLAALGGVQPGETAVGDLIDLGLLERGIGKFPKPEPATNWRANELESITMCAGPGLTPEGTAPPPELIRVTPQGRFVLNAVVAKLSKSFVLASA